MYVIRISFVLSDVKYSKTSKQIVIKKTGTIVVSNCCAQWVEAHENIEIQANEFLCRAENEAKTQHMVKMKHPWDFAKATKIP